MSELDDLEHQIAELQAKKKAILDENRAKDLEEARKLVQRHGFTAIELGITASGRRKQVPKKMKPITFRDASDPENILEWGGELKQLGNKPDWIKKRIADGTIEQYRV